MQTISLVTHAREELVDITAEVARAAAGLSDGVIWLHCPHTTAALVVQENTDPDLRLDLLAHLKKLVPQPGFRHAEGNADAHIKAALLNITHPILVEKGALVLGTWQAIYFVELDGPRRREVKYRASAF